MEDEFDERMLGYEESADQNLSDCNFNEMTLRDYIEVKYKQYLESGLDENNWNMLRSQINSGVALGIQLERIDIYAQTTLDYAQREVLKYALYDEIEEGYIRELAESHASAEVLRAKIYDKKVNIKLSEELSTPLQILSDSISTYKQDIDSYKEQANKDLKMYKDKLESAEIEISNLKAQLEAERKSNEEQMQIIHEREQRELERKKFEERVEKAAQEKFARMQLEETANRERMEIERRKIEDEFQSKHHRGFWKKRKIEPEKARKSIPLSAVEQLPPGFNLTAYIMSAGLSAGQMDVISLAVRSKVDDSIIKAMIDQQLPAAQMKQLLAVVLARGHQGNSMREEDIRYDEITYIED